VRFAAERPYGDLENAARKLVEIGLKAKAKQMKRPPGTSTWTQADDAKLRVLAVAGLSSREIATFRNEQDAKAFAKAKLPMVQTSTRARSIPTDQSGSSRQSRYLAG
jgi:hypothetical protein